MNWSVACGEYALLGELLIGGAANTVPGRHNRIRRGLRTVVDQHNLPLTYEIKMSENVLVQYVSFSHRSVLPSALTFPVQECKLSVGEMDINGYLRS